MEQWAWQMLSSQPDLSACGVLSYQPNRWATFAADLDPVTVVAAVDGVAGAGLIAIDRATEEVAIRDFLRLDGALTVPNRVKAAASAFAAIHSRCLCDVVLGSLPLRLRAHFPDDVLRLPPKAIGALLKDRDVTGVLPFPAAPAVVEEALEWLADSDLTRRQAAVGLEPVYWPDRYRTKLIEARRASDGELLTRLASERPGDTAEHLGRAVLRDTESPPLPPEEDCEHCTNGWVAVVDQNGDEVLAACPVCRPFSLYAAPDFAQAEPEGRLTGATGGA